MDKHKATCDICGSPVWIVSSGEGTNHYEPRIDARAAELEKELSLRNRILEILQFEFDRIIEVDIATTEAHAEIEEQAEHGTEA